MSVWLIVDVEVDWFSGQAKVADGSAAHAPMTPPRAPQATVATPVRRHPTAQPIAQMPLLQDSAAMSSMICFLSYLIAS